MFWHVREDGRYRLVGVGVRPNEHWGTLKANDGKWSSDSRFGPDGGSYDLSSNICTVTGKHGTAVWKRMWHPGDSGSRGTCSYVDIGLVERLFGGPAEVRANKNSCDLKATRVGWKDDLSIFVQNMSFVARETFLNRRNDGNNTPPKQDITGLGDGAFSQGNILTILKAVMSSRSRFAYIRMKPAARKTWY